MGFITISTVNAQAIDHTFTYQGELLDNGNPANDLYDISIQAYTTLTGLTTIGDNSIHEDGTPVAAVTVTDGIFTIDNVNLGINAFDGENIWLEISVKKSSDSGASYSALSPRQKLTAVPYAANLITNGAQQGEVLTFNGLQWLPATNTSSPWTVVSSNIAYTAGNVSIGSTANSFYPFNISTTTAQTANFNGGQNMYVYFEENGSGRGYIGSSLMPGGSILDEDFEIGTTGGSLGNMHIVTGNNQPRITVDNEGKVGINTTNPLATLFVQSAGSVNPFRVRRDGSTKLYVDNNGGVGIGSFSTPPFDGLLVSGEAILESKLRVNSDVLVTGELNSQDSGSADMKAYVYGFSNSTGALITNNSSTGFTVLRESTGQYKVTFTDTSINLNYISLVTLNSSSPKFATTVDNNDFFRVYIWDSSGTASNHAFKFVVYRK